MFQKARESSYLASESILNHIIQWRKPLFIIVAGAFVVSLIFSGPAFITPLYKSSVVFFPTATNSISKALLDVNASDKQDILAFGEEEQAEQMLQVLNSDAIRNAIITKYRLMEHFGIDGNDQYPMTRLYNKYDDRIIFRKTEYASIMIEVYDADAQMAADMANDIATLADSMKTKLQHDRALQALKIMEVECKEKEDFIRQKEDSLKWLGSQGVMNYKNEAVIWNEEYAKSFSIYNNEIAALNVLEKYKQDDDTAIVNTKARIEGARSRMKSLQGKLNQLVKYGGANVSLNEQLQLDREDLNKIRMQYSKLKIDAEQNLPHQFIINHAVRAEKTSYPVRWLMVAVSVLCSFLLAFIVLLFIERIKEYY